MQYAVFLAKAVTHQWQAMCESIERDMHLELHLCPIAGKKVTLLAKRDGGQISFRLREGVGDWVDKAPWRIEWGGGSSIENPHYQRVHYCQLLV